LSVCKMPSLVSVGVSIGLVGLELGLWLGPLGQY